MIARIARAIWRWFTAGGIDALVGAYARKKDSEIASERIEADLIKARIDAEIEGARNATEIRKATAGFWEMRALTFAIAMPFALHAGAVGFDTVFRFGWGIAAYPPPFDEWEGAILLSFFGVYWLTRGATAIAAGLAARRRG